MNHTRHPSNTRVLNAPLNWNHDQLPVDALAITDHHFDGVPCVSSFWQPDADEMAALNQGSMVMLTVVGGTMPPVALAVTVPEQCTAQPAPALADDTFADKAIAQMSIALAETPAGTLTNAVQLLVRPTDVRGDESGAHPGESFVMATITREEVRAMQAALDADWADHLRCTQPITTEVEPT